MTWTIPVPPKVMSGYPGWENIYPDNPVKMKRKDKSFFIVQIYDGQSRIHSIMLSMTFNDILTYNWFPLPMEIPATYPVLQAFWKLNPPVTASMSSTSPAKYNPFIFLLSMVLKSTSFKFTPPQATNSSLKVVLPETLYWS